MIFLLSMGFALSTYAQEGNSSLPDWVRNNFIWFGENQISETELLQAMQYLVKEGIIIIPNFGECAEGTELVDVQCISLIICGEGTTLTNNICEIIRPDSIIKKSGYQSFEDDSPFYEFSKNHPDFHMEDFEDGLLDTPGVTVNVGKVYGPSETTDSVDEDDGIKDGVCIDCRSFNVGERNNFLIITFDESKLKGLPTHAGIVVTDSTYGKGAPKVSQILISVIDSDGYVVHSEIIENLDFGKSGTANNDVFFGTIYEGGIKQFRIAIDYGSMEVDHLQYGR